MSNSEEIEEPYHFIIKLYVRGQPQGILTYQGYMQGCMVILPL